jgi:Fe-Mn family superoxide dismutase
LNEITRREAIGALGAAAIAGGWLGLTGRDAMAQEEKVHVERPPAPYELPPLPYAYDALEPHIDEQTMRLHHDKHHLGYVKGLNNALARLDAARRAEDFSAIKAISRDLAFNGSGHLLHSIFWQNMSPTGGGGPKDDLRKMIARDFGNVDSFTAQFKAAAGAVEGSGWGILAFEPLSGRLIIVQAEKHQNLTVWGVVPLLVVDVWEHAYYLKYQNRRGEYVDAFMEVVNWQNVAERLAGACRMKS